MVNQLTKVLVCSCLFGILGCDSGNNPPTQPIAPEIISIQWGAESVLPGQTRMLVAATTGSVSSYQWTLTSENAVLLAGSSSSAEVKFLRSGSVHGELSINGPGGGDSSEFTIDVGLPNVTSFSEILTVPLPGDAKASFEATSIIADGRLWILHDVEFPANPFPQFKVLLSSVPVESVENEFAWSSILFSENLCTPKRILTNGSLLGVVYSAQIVDDPEDSSQMILALAQLDSITAEEDFSKINLGAVGLGVPGERFQVRESALFVLDSRVISPSSTPFNQPVLGRISLTSTVTSDDYVEGDLPGRTGPFWDPLTLVVDEGIAIAWGYDRNHYILVKSVFPPWDTYDRGDIPMSSTATQVTGLGQWNENGLIMGFWDQGTGKQFVTTSPTRTPELNDWSTPVEVQQTLLGTPVIWGGRQVWHTTLSAPFPGPQSLARAVATPPMTLDDLVFAPIPIDDIGRSEIPNLVEINGRLVIAHPYDADGSGPEPFRIRLIRSDGPW